MRLHIVVSSLLVAAAWPGLGEAQSLGDVARDSPRLRRKATVKVYTDADLRSARGRPNFVEVVDTAEPEPQPLDLSVDFGLDEDLEEGEAAGLPAEPSEEEARAQRLADLKKQVDDENKVIAVVQQAMHEATTELNDLTILTYGGRRAYLVKIVEDGQKEIAKSQQVLADLEEQARREGFFLSR